MAIAGPNWAEVVTAVSSAVVSLSVIVVGWQIWESKVQAQTAFEDSLVRDYRETIRRIPTAALLGGQLTEQERAAAFDAFYQYFDLTNSQIKLHEEGRIRQRTWGHWRRGIRANLLRPEFRGAWKVVEAEAPQSFGGLRALWAEIGVEAPSATGPATGPAAGVSPES
jgi:hypothetical protein